MNYLYSLIIDDRHVTNWTDLQLACESFQTAIQVLAMVNAKCEVKLQKTALLNGTKPALSFDNSPQELALYQVADGGWNALTCTVKFEDGTFKEVAH